jgi:hypothetical protein
MKSDGMLAVKIIEIDRQQGGKVFNLISIELRAIRGFCVLFGSN